jgi:hypothetical protein
MPAHPGPRKARPECELVAGIHVFYSFQDPKDVDGRDFSAKTRFARP